MTTWGITWSTLFGALNLHDKVGDEDPTPQAPPTLHMTPDSFNMTPHSRFMFQVGIRPP